MYSDDSNHDNDNTAAESKSVSLLDFQKALTLEPRSSLPPLTALGFLQSTRPRQFQGNAETPPQEAVVVGDSEAMNAEDECADLLRRLKF